MFHFFTSSEVDQLHMRMLRYLESVLIGSILLCVGGALACRSPESSFVVLALMSADYMLDGLAIRPARDVLKLHLTSHPNDM